MGFVGHHRLRNSKRETKEQQDKVASFLTAKYVKN
jgi:hypothetical protein